MPSPITGKALDTSYWADIDELTLGLVRVRDNSIFLGPFELIRLGRPKITRNSVQWPILQSWAEQKQWPVNGSMCWLSPEEWKGILTAAFEGETNPRIAPGLEGGMVMLGRRTSRYGKKKFSEWLDWLNAASHHAEIKVPAAKQMEAA